jgi:hypothetical protein
MWKGCACNVVFEPDKKYNFKSKKDDVQIFVTQFFPTITADAPLGKVKNREGRAESQWAWKSPLLFIWIFANVKQQQHDE